jgi:CRISPR system Cascade subunit CasB
MQTAIGPKRERFVAYLQGMVDREDRAALAALRRGLGKRPGEAPEMFPYLVPWVGDATPREEADLYLVASLFALHPVSWTGEGDGRRQRNVGASLARLRAKTESGGAEQRFVALLNARREDLSDGLRRIVALCKAHEIAIDWGQLLDDLRRRDRDSRDVQRRWAAAFWAGTGGVGVDASEEAEREQAVTIQG